MPSTELDQCPLDYLTKRYAFNCIKKQELMSMRHSFSHFHLEISALAIQTSVDPNRVAERSGKWFTAEEIQELGLAKPVREIIQHYLACHS